jgi:hypothetical protein
VVDIFGPIERLDQSHLSPLGEHPGRQTFRLPPPRIEPRSPASQRALHLKSYPDSLLKLFGTSAYDHATSGECSRQAFKYSTFPPKKKKYLKYPSPLNSKKVFERLNNSTWGVTESRGVRGKKTGKKQNGGALCLLIQHNSGCRCTGI